jgi:hypothetical protein
MFAYNGELNMIEVWKIKNLRSSIRPVFNIQTLSKQEKRVTNIKNAKYN